MAQQFNVDIDKLNIASFNIRGLRRRKKMNAVIKSLKNSKFEIIALQETHLLKKDIEEFKQLWRDPIIYSEGTNLSKGLCILFNSYFKDKNISVFVLK